MFLGRQKSASPIQRWRAQISERKRREEIEIVRYLMADDVSCMEGMPRHVRELSRGEEKSG